MEQKLGLFGDESRGGGNGKFKCPDLQDPHMCRVGGTGTKVAIKETKDGREKSRVKLSSQPGKGGESGKRARRIRGAVFRGLWRD